MKYPHLLKHSHISLWRQITGLMENNLENDNHNKIDFTSQSTIPLLLVDSITLLLRIMLSLPYLVTKGTLIYEYKIFSSMNLVLF